MALFIVAKTHTKTVKIKCSDYFASEVTNSSTKLEHLSDLIKVCFALRAYRAFTHTSLYSAFLILCVYVATYAIEEFSSKVSYDLCYVSTGYLIFSSLPTVSDTIHPAPSILFSLSLQDHLVLLKEEMEDGWLATIIIHDLLNARQWVVPTEFHLEGAGRKRKGTLIN